MRKVGGLIHPRRQIVSNCTYRDESETDLDPEDSLR